jgi:hypothetical protein
MEYGNSRRLGAIASGAASKGSNGFPVRKRNTPNSWSLPAIWLKHENV